MERIDGYAPIREYALVGDGRTAALIARDGSVDWLCLPNFDSPSVFARILDIERGGSFRLEPAAAFQADRRYLDNSNVLETTFVTADGRVRVTDAMTLSDSRQISPMRELVRKVEALAGTVPLRWAFQPRFGYGHAKTRIERRAGRWFARAGADVLVLGLFGADDGELRDGAVTGELALASGESAVFSLTGASREPAVISGREDSERRLELTKRFWPEWAGRHRYEGAWPEAVTRSALALKLLIFAPSGAIVAAPTTSLPEWIGGARNWDYRFTWLRDASWALDAMLRLGYHDEAHAFFWWLMHASRLTQPRLQVLYRLDGSVHARERELSWLSGYRGSAPARIGNGARNQVQLDIYGSVLEAIWVYAQAVGRLDGETGKEVARIADYVEQHWHDKDNGIWEVRDERSHYIQSKGLCWVALDRACALGEQGLIPNRSDRWRAAADELEAWVDEHGWDDELQSLVRAPDLREVDASLLTLAVLGYKDDRLDATIAAVERDLREGPYVYRYRGDDGLAGDEGAFLTCSFWLVDAYAQNGRLDDANALMEELVGLANDVGLYSEEIDPRTGEFLGNFPQGLTHLALVNAAVTIADLEAQGKGTGSVTVSLWGALAGGAVGTIVLSSGLRVAQELGVTRMDIPLLLGTIFTDQRGRASVVGYVIHFANGLVFALAYYAIFRAVGHAGWLFGAALGLVHACLAAGALLTVLLPAVHPRMGTPWSDAEETPLLEAPGFLLMNYGRRTVFWTVVGHLVYGAIVGGFAAGLA